MTFKYNNVYIYDTATLAGPYEKRGPLGAYYDKTFEDMYFKSKTFEQAEINILSDCVNMLLEKTSKRTNDIDVFISGDLMNQIVASNYSASYLQIPFIGVYGACSTSMLANIVAANMVNSNQVKNVITSVSSHNNTAEKQFRYPIEYGAPKPKRSTFTTTGAASCLISRNKSKIKIESATIGKVVDMGIKDVFHMGAVMAPSAADTIFQHLKDTKRGTDYYDLILTGDLGIYGKDILKEYIKTEYNTELENYDDSACMIFDINNQEVYAGGSGPACLPLVAYSYILDKMKSGKINRVLLVATGALMNTTLVNQKMTIPAISHAISLEVEL